MNKILLASVLSFVVCKIVKTIVNLCVSHVDFKKALFGGGSMPSTRAGGVIALVYSTGVVEGIQGFEFAVAVVFAFIMLFDSVYVRKEVEKHSNILKEHFDVSEYKLKQYSGHNLKQATVGGLIGLFVAIVVCLV